MFASDTQVALEPQLMKILLVEDSVLLREAILETLSSCHGLTFEGVAGTQKDGIKMLRERPFDLLMVDIELAEGNGFEVIRATQQADYPFKPPKYMVLTNHAHAQYRHEARALGVHYFFDKSMDFDLAIETIESEVEQYFSNNRNA